MTHRIYSWRFNIFQQEKKIYLKLLKKNSNISENNIIIVKIAKVVEIVVVVVVVVVVIGYIQQECGWAKP